MRSDVKHCVSSSYICCQVKVITAKPSNLLQSACLDHGHSFLDFITNLPAIPVCMTVGRTELFLKMTHFFHQGSSLSRSYFSEPELSQSCELRLCFSIYIQVLRSFFLKKIILDIHINLSSPQYSALQRKSEKTNTILEHYLTLLSVLPAR